MDKKELYNKSVSQFAGEVGEFAFNVHGVDYHVGDIVSFSEHLTNLNNDNIGVVTINKSCRLGYGVCGIYTKDAREIGIKKILPFTLLTQEILSHYKDHLVIRDLHLKEMTVQEIEKELGYKIKIIGE